MSKRRYPWPSFGGRFDPAQPKATVPNIHLVPGAATEKFVASIIRVAQWYIERAEYLGHATWDDPVRELEKREADLARATGWIWSAGGARELGRRAFAVAEGKYAGEQAPPRPPQEKSRRGLKRGSRAGRGGSA